MTSDLEDASRFSDMEAGMEATDEKGRKAEEEAASAVLSNPSKLTI